ncbi:MULTISPECIES: hypothetical protein [Salinibaculum]|uniref:hypothetical protein n=1 Tax=Salinibaculum TaxID=2732368 RepID=UPI0030D52281
MNRRNYLASIGAVTVTLAGCTSSDDGGDGDGDSGGSGSSGGSQPTQTETPTPTPQEILAETRTIPEDEWYQWGYDFETALDISIDMVVREGPAVDFWLLTESEFQEFDAGNRFRPTLEISDTTGGSTSGVIDPGRVYFIADNTNAGEAEPPTNLDDDIARVEVTVIAERA